MEKLINTASKFDCKGEVVKVERYGHGHINDTYLVTTIGGPRYLMQRINHKVFKNVKALMENIVNITEYTYEETKRNNGNLNTVMVVIPTKSGEKYLEEDGNFYRMYNFIEGALSIERRATPEEFRLSAVGFGRFQKLLDSFPAEKLHETIKDFHNTVVRYNNFIKALEEDPLDRKKDCAEEIAFFKTRKHYCGRIVNMLASGEIPLRVTHNDTKLNNVLIDLDAMVASTVIDLDTVMPGSIVYDFGDSIRSGATTGAEDEKDLSKVNFSLELFEAYAEGFISEVGERLTETEKEELAFGAILMTFECGMRFLTDHINGDTYFRIHREGHNLDRARTQIKLVQDMEKSLDKMKAIVRKYC